ncbi:glycosyltransferase family 2 protein [Maribacter sp. 2307ULW6-5]|uniref:glycosyltransferase family 2 protein n=1 Tax=Maribacter sp. 2307ULW6-5 TaxID=3386275 RepID=UPI0039BD316A
MTKQPLVSILVPFKNTAEYVTECLDSVLAQTYAHWEVIAVNDGSTDQSRSLVSKYAQKDGRIALLDNQGKGIIPALRAAFAQSGGDLITRMDSDDIMQPNKLEVMVRALQAHGPKHLAIGQVRYFSHRGISNGYARYEAWLNGLTATGSNYSEIYKECVVPSPCWMVHREDLLQVRAFEPNRYPEDYDLTFRFYEAQLACIPCDQVLHLWRDYDTRTSRTSEHYAQNYFLDIKLHYFLMLDRDPSVPLVVWGAGNKGKTIAKALVHKGVDFHWICDNPNKIGKTIYGKLMRSVAALNQLDRAQSIVTVANEDAQADIRAYFHAREPKPMQDHFFFC